MSPEFTREYWHREQHPKLRIDLCARPYHPSRVYPRKPASFRGQTWVWNALAFVIGVYDLGENGRRSFAGQSSARPHGPLTTAVLTVAGLPKGPKSCLSRTGRRRQSAESSLSRYSRMPDLVPPMPGRTRSAASISSASPGVLPSSCR
jgi:hypothetical protein